MASSSLLSGRASAIPVSTELSVAPEKRFSSKHVCRASMPGIAFSCRRLSIKARLPFSPARFISVLSVAPRRDRDSRRNAIVALDPDFYKIPHVEGVPVGKRLKLWNLPPKLDRQDFLDWFKDLDGVTVESLELTDDPDLNAQGIGGFMEFATKMDACMAIVRRDGHKFKGRCIRMDFVEKKPHEREIGGRRNRPSYRNRSQPVSDYQPRSSYGSGYGDYQPRSSYATGGTYAGSGAGSPGYGATGSASVSSPPGSSTGGSSYSSSITAGSATANASGNANRPAAVTGPPPVTPNSQFTNTNPPTAAPVPPPGASTATGYSEGPSSYRSSSAPAFSTPNSSGASFRATSTSSYGSTSAGPASSGAPSFGTPSAATSSSYGSASPSSSGYARTSTFPTSDSFSRHENSSTVPTSSSPGSASTFPASVGGSSFETSASVPTNPAYGSVSAGSTSADASSYAASPAAPTSPNYGSSYSAPSNAPSSMLGNASSAPTGVVGLDHGYATNTSGAINSGYGMSRPAPVSGGSPNYGTSVDSPKNMTGSDISPPNYSTTTSGFASTDIPNYGSPGAVSNSGTGSRYNPVTPSSASAPHYGSPSAAQVSGTGSSIGSQTPSGARFGGYSSGSNSQGYATVPGAPTSVSSPGYGSPGASNAGIGGQQYGNSVTEPYSSGSGPAYYSPQSTMGDGFTTSAVGSQSPPGYGSNFETTSGNYKSAQSAPAYAGTSTTGVSQSPTSYGNVQSSPNHSTSHSSGSYATNTGYGSNEGTANYGRTTNFPSSTPVAGYAGTHPSSGYGSSGGQSTSGYSSPYSDTQPASNYGSRDSPSSFSNTNMACSYSNPNYGSGYGSPSYGASGYGQSTYGGGSSFGTPRGYRIFVGNLPWSSDDSSLGQLFASHGTVLEARVMRERDTGRSRGFGFVSMSSVNEMQAAISALNGYQVDGRPIKVNEAER